MSDTIKPMAAAARIRSILFPVFNELQFVMALAVGVTLCFANSKFGHSVSTQLQDGRSFSLVAILFIILLIIGSKQKLPISLKAWASVLYYGFFAFIARSALDRHNMQVHGGTIFARINFWLVCAILILSIARGIIALLVVRDIRINKLTAQSFCDVQYTAIGFGLGTILSIVSTIIMGIIYHNPAQAALLSFTFASIGITLVTYLVPGRIRSL